MNLALHKVFLASLLFILVLGAVSFLPSAHAQTVAMSLSTSIINVQPGTYSTITVTLSSLDGLDHSILLALDGSGVWWDGWVSASFAPNPITVRAVRPVVAVLSVAISASDVCLGHDYTDYISDTFTVSAYEGGVLENTATLTMNLIYRGSTLSVSIDASRSSYMVGDTVSLRMDSNLPASFTLVISKPDGTTWATSSGTLPRTYTRVATDPVGIYTAELAAYYCGTEYASTTFTVEPNTFTVDLVVSGLPSELSTVLTIDGVDNGVIAGGATRSLSYPLGILHQFQVGQYVESSTGARYYCASNTWSASSTGARTFSYVAQYYLTVVSPYGDPTGEGWYNAGDTATFGVTTPDAASAGTQHVSTGYAVGTDTSTNPSGVTVMDSAKQVTFSWATQYYLTVSTDPVGIAPTAISGWYDAGTDVSIPAAATEILGATGVKYSFYRWEVDRVDAGNAALSVTMNAPHAVIAEYTTLYLLTLNSEYGAPSGAGYYPAGAVAHFSVEPSIGFGIQQVMTGWTGDYTGTNAQGSITMTSPKTIQATWTTSYVQAGLIAGVVAVVAILAVAGWLTLRKKPSTTSPATQ